ncbi:MAG: alpha/beta fold hydrolase [Acidobacteriota bacterium]|nr:alpha/beta fold hydrolase [Acidobacteriota bacterium]
MSKTVVLIHGAGVTPACWDHFVWHYERRGYTCVAPAWPFADRPVAQLRHQPDPAFGRLTIRQIVDHHERLVRALPEPPILIGHSFGGLFVQMLLDRGLGAAGVAIEPAPCAGVFPAPATLRQTLPMLMTWGSWSRPVSMTLSQFARSCMHLSTPAEQREAFERYVVPAPGRIYFQAGLSIGNGVDFRNDGRAPLLLLAGDEDRLVPKSMVDATFRRQRQSRALTEYRSLAGRTHFVIAVHGWQEVADVAIDWASRHARSRTGGGLTGGPSGR